MSCPHAASALKERGQIKNGHYSEKPMGSRSDHDMSPHSQLEAFIKDQAFPCVGAKAALVRGALEMRSLGDLRSNADDVALWLGLSDFAKSLEPGCAVVQSFAVLFPETPKLSEVGFEHALWARLQGLHYIDTQMGERWSTDTSNDPGSNNFSLSVAGESFFVIGLHPGASRPARQFGQAALIFNSNAQFEALRADGRYDQMKKIIRQRDTQLAGDINPMLKDFGQGSEAAQYSGRLVSEDWQCPFSARKPVTLDLKPQVRLEAAE